MKIILGLFLGLVLAVDSFGSPLIFKTIKEISTTDSYIELATIDVSKYKNVRVGVSILSDNSNNKAHAVQIYALEDNSNFLMDTMNIYSSKSVSLQTVSSKIKISANSTGKYKVYVWAD